MIIIIKDNFINNTRYQDQNTLLNFFPIKLPISIFPSNQHEVLFVVFNYRRI
jgi:hypothetical protein